MARWLLRSMIFLATMLLAGLCSDQPGEFGTLQMRVYYTQTTGRKMTTEGILGEVDEMLRFRQTAVIPDFGPAAWTPEGEVFVAPAASGYIARYQRDGKLVEKIQLPAIKIMGGLAYVPEQNALLFSMGEVIGAEAEGWEWSGQLYYWDLRERELTGQRFDGGDYVYDAHQNRLWVAADKDSTYFFQGIEVVYENVLLFHYDRDTRYFFQDVDARGELLYGYRRNREGEPQGVHGWGLYTGAIAEIVYECRGVMACIESPYYGGGGFVFVRRDPAWSTDDLWWLDEYGKQFIPITRDFYGWKTGLVVSRVDTQ